MFRIDENGHRTTTTPQDDRVIRDNYLALPPQRIADIIGRSETLVKNRMKQLGLIVPRHIIEKRIADSRIKPGNVSFNKGKRQSDYMSPEAIERTKASRFKKGNLPHNCYHEVGKESIRRDKSGVAYKYVCIKIGKWVPLHTRNWERENGKIPKGHCLWCRDGDTLNCSPDNWELITRGENLRRNNLSDSGIASRLSQRPGLGKGKRDNKLKNEYLKHPELIDLKRKQLQLNAAIKSRDNHEA